MGNYDFDSPGYDHWIANSDGNQHGNLRLPNMDWNMDDKRELIDFPCASNWLNYYFLRGMTPRRPIAYPQPQSTPDATESLREGFQSISDAIREIQLPKPSVPVTLPAPTNVPKGYPQEALPPALTKRLKGISV